MSLPRSLVFASFSAACALGAGALLLPACSGGKLSLGTNGTTQSAVVSPSDVAGTPGACPANAAHPNVCCTAGPDQPATCVDYPGAPFTPCASGATTYPDPRSCCPLDGSGSCSAPPPLDAGIGVGGGSGSGGCAYACPPGWYAPPNPVTPDECCQNDGNGVSACMGGGPANGSSCACPSCPPGNTCPPCDCPPTPDPSCGACPAGWQVPVGDPAQCCMTDANGVIECFSQAGPPSGGGSGSSGGGVGQADADAPPPPLDAGAAPPMACSGSGGGPDGGVGQCGCQEQSTDGHTYAVNCDPGSNVCACTVDNGAPTATFPDDGNTCSDPMSLFAACGYPTN